MVDLKNQIIEARRSKSVQLLESDKVKKLIKSLYTSLSIKPSLIPNDESIDFIVNHLKKYSRFTVKEYVLACEFALNGYYEFNGTYGEPFGVKHISQLMGHYKDFAMREMQRPINGSTYSEPAKPSELEKKNRQARRETAISIYKYYLDGTHGEKIHAEVLYLFAYKHLVESGVTDQSHADKFRRQAEATINKQVDEEKAKLVGRGSLTLARLVKPKESDEEIQMYRLALLDLFEGMKSKKVTLEQFKQKLK